MNATAAPAPAAAQEKAAPATPPAAAGSWGEVPRMDFNRLAAELYLPLFWRTDKDGDQQLDADGSRRCGACRATATSLAARSRRR